MVVSYPYLPKNREIKYVPEDNEFMAKSMEFARQHNTVKHIGAAVIVKEGRVIGYGSIGASVHAKQGGCIREKMNVPTGTQYELCEGCDSKYHSEADAIRDAKENGKDTRGADLYLWGHWWLCEPCWNAIIEAGIRDVYLLKNSEILFNKENPKNVIGRQFE